MPNDPAREQAFDELVRAHYDRLCDFVYRYVRSREVAEDIVQDIFVRVLQNPTFDPQDPLAYLYGAAHNGMASYIRRHRVRERFRVESAAPPGPPPADAETEYHELANAVAHAIDSLPERAREIFRRATDAAEAEALIAAGDLSLSAITRSVLNTKGLWAYERSSYGEFSLTARTKDGTGSGWARSGYED